MPEARLISPPSYGSGANACEVDRYLFAAWPLVRSFGLGNSAAEGAAVELKNIGGVCKRTKTAPVRLNNRFFRVMADYR